MRSIIQFLVVFYLGSLVTTSLLAEETRETFADWVLVQKQINSSFCYITSSPIEESGNYDIKGQPYFLVTNTANDSDEISTSHGLIYNKNSDVTISFKRKKFYLFPYRTVAWTINKSDDFDIIKEMQKSDEMVITGYDKNYRYATETYSLVGFSQAYNKMKRICNDTQ